MIRQQVMERGIRDERVIDALRAVPRDLFFPPGSRDQAFADRAASIGHGQTISQPYMVALMTARLNVQPGQRVLEIGTGSGYQTAILAKLASEVWTMERVKPLLDTAFERLGDIGVRNVHYRLGDGTLGWPDAAPFDRILIGAGAPSVPVKLLTEQLAEGGLAILPVGSVSEQLLIQVRKQDGVLQQSELCACRFVKLIGEEGWGEEKAG